MTGTTNAQLQELKNEIEALKREIELIKDQLKTLTTPPLRTGRSGD